MAERVRLEQLSDKELEDLVMDLRGRVLNADEIDLLLEAEDEYEHRQH